MPNTNPLLKHSLGWKKQLPDIRDRKFVPTHKNDKLPPSVDLTGGMGSVLDQNALGACGSNATASLIMYDQQAQGLTVDLPARLFIYWVTRVLMGDTKDDTGVDNRTMLKALNQYGFCSETLWPYDISKFAVQPPTEDFTAAAANQITSYAAVNQDSATMKGCLADNRPFLFGFTVYESFESSATNATGIVSMPKTSESVLGGHDVAICAFDDNGFGKIKGGAFKFKNSWGSSWGDGGFGFFPYAYCLDPNLSSDFWVINSLGGVTPPPPPSPPTPPGPPPITTTWTIPDGYEGILVAGMYEIRQKLK